MQRDMFGSSGNYATPSSASFMNKFYGNYDYSSLMFPPNPSLVDHGDSHLFSASPVLTSQLPQPKYHQECNRLLLARIQEMSKQAQGLRQENVNLRTVNEVLTRQIESLVKVDNERSVSTFDVDLIAEELRKMYSGEEWNGESTSGENLSGSEGVGGGGGEGVGDGSGGDNVERVMLPKSIAVRSREYLKGASQGSSGGKSGVAGQNLSKSGNEGQKVYVPGGVEKEQPLEVEVYNQGMFKTELCNKWQQVGTCPYGQNCQFAHGLDELRPVLRHPRYKTAVCRMILNGDPCPYGHRCHFRHYLTEEEKLMRSINSESLNHYISSSSSYAA